MFIFGLTKVCSKLDSNSRFAKIMVHTHVYMYGTAVLACMGNEHKMVVEKHGFLCLASITFFFFTLSYSCAMKGHSNSIHSYPPYQL